MAAIDATLVDANRNLLRLGSDGVGQENGLIHEQRRLPGGGISFLVVIGHREADLARDDDGLPTRQDVRVRLDSFVPDLYLDAPRGVLEGEEGELSAPTFEDFLAIALDHPADANLGPGVHGGEGGGWHNRERPSSTP